MDNKPPRYVRRIEDLPPGRHFVVVSNEAVTGTVDYGFPDRPESVTTEYLCYKVFTSEDEMKAALTNHYKNRRDAKIDAVGMIVERVLVPKISIVTATEF